MAKMQTPKPRSGGNALIAALAAQGASRIFCVPGESYLDALDALVDSPVSLVTCRHEGAAAFMAEAWGKLTGEPGLCFVTRGPGACNAAIGLHTARQDSTPMILLVGQVARADLGREAFQEIDYRQMFAPPVAKLVLEAGNADELPALVARAWQVALEGRPGPVVLSLPEDVLTEMTEEADAPTRAPARRGVPQADLTALAALMKTAQRPFLLLGGGSWTETDIARVEGFCARHHLPVVLSFRRQDVFDNTHPCYAGTLGTTVDAALLDDVRKSDLVIAVGTRIGDITTQGYQLINPLSPKQKIVHLYPDAAELGRVYPADLAIHADVGGFAAAVETLVLSVPDEWQRRTAQLHRRYEDWSRLPDDNRFSPDAVAVMRELLLALPDNAVITTDAGNFSGWAQRYIRYRRPMRLLAPTAGAMGYGVPSAVAASLAEPGRCVVSFAGDGGFAMTMADVSTAVQHGAAPLFLVFDNGMYGTIRMHQEKHYPGRVSGTDLKNPDFTALAQAMGVMAQTVDANDGIKDVLAKALAETRAGRPALVHIRMAPQQLTTGPTLDDIRAAAQKEKA